MSLESLVGAQIVAGLPGTDATPALLAHLERLHIQSIILFERNLTSAAQTTQLIRTLETGLGRPLLVMIDHEGGRIVRLRRDLTPFPSARDAASRGDPGTIERQGAVEAEELARLGIRVNLAPCVDVVAEGSDPIIGDRSYGSDPARVSAFGVARIRGLQSHGVAACAKHFPGLGAVGRDPHKTLPTIQLDWEIMRATHLPPFAAAIAAGVATVMSSHVCYPGLGELEGLPATFSERLIDGWLRKELGFRGAILSDDLLMGALTYVGDPAIAPRPLAVDGTVVQPLMGGRDVAPLGADVRVPRAMPVGLHMGEVAVRTAAAGHDLLLICDNLSAQEQAFSGLLAAYQSGRLPRAALEASGERIQRLRREFLPRP